jgi:ribosome biogenesis ATPase
LSTLELTPFLSHQSESSSRVVNTLLTELDGLEARVQTYVIGATNRPDMIDPAMCRPGRLDKMLYVDLPNQEERIKILKTLTKKTPLARQKQKLQQQQSDNGGVGDSDDFEWLEDVGRDSRCEGFSGADLAALVREASVLALREKLKEHRQGEQTNEMGGVTAPSTTPVVGANFLIQVDSLHFHAALDKVQPSVGLSQRKKYNSLRSRLSGFPGGRNNEQSGNTSGSGKRANDEDV